MRKVVEAAGGFALCSLFVMLSINYLAHTHVISYTESLVLYGLSNLLFKNSVQGVKQCTKSSS